MNYTVLGSSGFIGSHLSESLRLAGHEVQTPAREDLTNTKKLGHAIYCIGMTSDFRAHPHETVDAHISQLSNLLKSSDFDSFTYLSSTRVYQFCTESIVDENTILRVRSQVSGNLYNLSKLMGESLLTTYGDRIRIARLSNVVGRDFNSQNFLFSVIRDCRDKGHVDLKQSLTSEKDYVDIRDVVELLSLIGPEGRCGIYNVASGENTTHRQLLDIILPSTGATYSVAENAPEYSFPRISNKRAVDDFGFNFRPVLDALPELLNQSDAVIRNK